MWSITIKFIDGSVESYISPTVQDALTGVVGSFRSFTAKRLHA